MKAAELRQSILQAAVQGKLAPHNPQDEPASELLKRIQQEKARLIKEGKLKKEKPLPPVAEDEIPYDLPEGWVWCRFQDIASFFNGDRSKNYPNKAEYVSYGIPWINTGHILPNGTLTQEGMNYISEEKYLSLSGGKIKPGDLVFCLRGATFGKVAKVVPYSYGAVASSLMLIRASQLIDVDYLLYLLKSPYATAELRKYDNGSAQPNLAAKDVAKYCIPLPPLNEQFRIVAKVNELLALCDELETEEKKLDALEAHFAEYLPKAILQAAVQGKLVPQNSHNEPASELLKRIQQEKAQLVKEGKLKKEKPLPPISEDEIPYDLPEGWEWCRFGEIALLISGRDLEPSSYNDQQRGIPYITGASNLIGDDLDINRWTEKPIVISQKGDILLSCKGTIGKALFNRVGDCHIARQIMAIRPIFTHILPQYISIMLAASIEYFVEQARSIIPGISRKDILNLVVAVPPLAEQQRIVEKVDELMTLCDELKTAYKIPVVPSSHNNIIPFPTTQKEEETLLAARGDVGQLSNEAMQAINDLFAEDEE